MAVAFVAKANPTTNPVTTTAISLSVTVVAGEYIVLSIEGGGPATVTTPPSGGGLTYTQQVAQNPGGSLSCTYIYTAPCPTSQTFTLTATMSASGPSYGVTVARYTGVGSVGAANSAHGTSGSTGVPTMTLTTTAANSVVSASSGDFTPASGAATWVTTSGTPTTISDVIAAGSSAAHEAYYTFPTVGSKTIGQSAPTGQAWTIGAVELVPTTGALTYVNGTFTASNFATGTSSTTSTYAIPTGVASGDLLVAVMSSDSTVQTISGSWTLRGSLQATPYPVAVYYRIAGGSEPASYDFTSNGSNGDSEKAGILHFTGHDSVTPLGIPVFSSSTTTTLTYPSVTAASAGSYLITFAGGSGGSTTFTAPSGMTEVEDDTDTWLSQTIDYLAGVAAGATGTKAGTSSAARTNMTIGSVIINPAGSSGSASDRPPPLSQVARRTAAASW